MSSQDESWDIDLSLDECLQEALGGLPQEVLGQKLLDELRQQLSAAINAKISSHYSNSNSESSDFSAISDVSEMSEASCATFSTTSTQSSSTTSELLGTTSRPSPLIKRNNNTLKRKRCVINSQPPSVFKSEVLPISILAAPRCPLLLKRDNPPEINAVPQADGLYHSPWEKEPGSRSQHKPEGLKGSYKKFIDSHLKPYRCKVLACKNLNFSSTVCLLQHEREAHAMHVRGDKPFLCTYDGCERGVPGNGFPHHWNLRDHMRRVHSDMGKPEKPEAPRPSSEPACITCRKGKKWCDKKKPSCMNCEEKSIICGYPEKTIWKSSKEKAEEDRTVVTPRNQLVTESKKRSRDITNLTNGDSVDCKISNEPRNNQLEDCYELIFQPLSMVQDLINSQIDHSKPQTLLEGDTKARGTDSHDTIDAQLYEDKEKFKVEASESPQMPRDVVYNHLKSPRLPVTSSFSSPKGNAPGKASPYLPQSQDGESDSYFETEHEISDDECEVGCFSNRHLSLDSFDVLKKKLLVNILGSFWDTYNQKVTSIISYCIVQLALVENSKQSLDNIDRSTSQASVSAPLLPQSFASSSRKRILGDEEFPEDDDGKGSKGPDEERSRPLIDTLPFKYACPFRKHNPRKYNVHHFQQCALGCFSSIARLKEHLYRRHIAQIQCVRCWLFFKDQEDLNIHMMANNICERRDGQLAEGVTPSMEKKLRKRTRLSGDQKDEDRWRDIYRMLFPGEDIPSPFYEPVQDEAAPNLETPDISVEEFLRQEVPDIFTSRLQIEVNNMDLQESGLLDNPTQLRQNFIARLDNLIREAQDAAIQSYRQRFSETTSQNNQMPTPAPSSSSGSFPTPIPESRCNNNSNSLDFTMMPVYGTAGPPLSFYSENSQDVGSLYSEIGAAVDEDCHSRPKKRARYEPHLPRKDTQSEEFALPDDPQREDFNFGDFDIWQADLGNDIDFANFDFSTWNLGTNESQEPTS